MLATVFVSLPFVARETIPVLRELGDEQEQAAATLGAGTFATFRRITLPAIRPAVSYGIVLTAARSLGEFGAVTIVSGNIVGKTQTLPLEVQAQFEEPQPAGRVCRLAGARALRRAHARRAHHHSPPT